MKPLRVKAAVKEEASALCVIYLSAVFGTGAIVASPFTKLAWIPLLAAGILLPAILLRHRRLKGREVQIDEEGVSSLVEGNVVATVPWSRYGAFRKLQVPIRVRLWYPERCGTELLDKQGVVIGVIPLEQNSRVRAKQRDLLSESLKRAKIFHELESRSQDWDQPEPGFFSTTARDVRRHYAAGTAFLLPAIGYWARPYTSTTSALKVCLLAVT